MNDFPSILHDLSAYDASIPTTLNVLVHPSIRTRSRQERFTALCTQFSVTAEGDTTTDAVAAALKKLVKYLAACKREKVAPQRYVPMPYIEVFDNGQPILTDLHRIRVREGRRLAAGLRVHQTDPASDRKLRAANKAAAALMCA
jgi:hypothetical protein